VEARETITMAARTTLLCAPRRLIELGTLLTATAAACTFAGPAAPAATIVIEPGQSIQAVIDDPATVDGDVIIAMPGVYQEQIDFRGKAITLQSAAPLDGQTVAATVLDGGGAGTVITCASGEGPLTMLDGFTVTNGYIPGGGGGMWILLSSPTIRNCVFTANHAMFEGGAMLLDWDSSPTIINCRFFDNTAIYGGALALITSRPTIVNCAFAGNTALYTGGAIDNYAQSDAAVLNCTFSANYASSGGAIANGASALTMANSVLWGDTPDEIYDDSGSALVTWCDVQGGYAGGGNIDADPLFVDAVNGDYRLASGSPCIDAASNDDVPADTTDLDDDGDIMEPVPLDLDGCARFADDPAAPDTGNGDPPIVDMGAWEHEPEGGLELELPLDIQPRRCPNRLNRRCSGFLPVVLLGTAEVDVRTVDRSTLSIWRADGVGGSVAPCLGRPGPSPMYWDVTGPAEPCECEVLPPDGMADLTLRFPNYLLMRELELNELPRGTSVELVLSGALDDGTPFTATDCVTVTGQPKTHGVAHRWRRR
jgi:hypothetical protein